MITLRQQLLLLLVWLAAWSNISVTLGKAAQASDWDSHVDRHLLGGTWHERPAEPAKASENEAGRDEFRPPPPPAPSFKKAPTSTSFSPSNHAARTNPKRQQQRNLLERQRRPGALSDENKEKNADLERTRRKLRATRLGSYSYSYVQFSMAFPTSRPSSSPSQSYNPTSHPTRAPTTINTRPTFRPTSSTTSAVYVAPPVTTAPPFTYSPSGKPSSLPTSQPTSQPSSQPTSKPSTGKPTDSIYQDSGFSDATGLFFVIGGAGSAKSNPALTRTNAVTIDVAGSVGADSGGFAVSKSKVFLAGDTATAAFSKTGLSLIGPIPALKGAAFCSNLANNTVYALADSNLAPLKGPGTISFLLAIDDATMLPATTYKLHVGLNTPISVGYHSGIFSGYNRIVIVDRDTLAVWNINLFNGHVIYLGSALCKWAYTKSWASWGIAEFSYERKIHLLYGSAGGGGIERQSVNDGVRDDGDPSKGTHFRSIEMVYQGNLGDLVSFSVDLSTNRWYFQYTGSGDFVGLRGVTLGYANAVFGFHVPTGHPTGQPSRAPSTQPSRRPTQQPTGHPTREPSTHPTSKPSKCPTRQPSAQPTSQPTGRPSVVPSQVPFTRPTAAPTGQPSRQPSSNPSGQPSTQPSSLPTRIPSGQPTREPSRQPTNRPTTEPSGQPTGRPSPAPTPIPSVEPTPVPTVAETLAPTAGPPTLEPTAYPSTEPTPIPSEIPTPLPSALPTTEPTFVPTLDPTLSPTPSPTSPSPTTEPTPEPTADATKESAAPTSYKPTVEPTREPSTLSTIAPSPEPTGIPTGRPSSQPSRQPTGQPSSRPTHPTGRPSGQPSSLPSGKPTGQPSSLPTGQPSRQPSTVPSAQPSSRPSRQPTCQPTSIPTHPTGQPSSRPSSQPVSRPTSQPSGQPSGAPTRQPQKPTGQPSMQPSTKPTSPSGQPSGQPTRVPTGQPSQQPSSFPTMQPSTIPSAQPSQQPTSLPSAQPSGQPSQQPSAQPTSLPSSQPSMMPTLRPTSQPSSRPSRCPTGQPTSRPTCQPSSKPSKFPTGRPTGRPSGQPSAHPSSQPTSQPTRIPTNTPVNNPTSQPSGQPSMVPTRKPTGQPSSVPSLQPSSQPSRCPSRQPSSQPSLQPFSRPSSSPTGQPTNRPNRPTGQPTGKPSRSPSGQPTTRPTTNIPTFAPTVLEPKMFLKNNVINIKISQKIDSSFFTAVTIKSNKYAFSYSRAIYTLLSAYVQAYPLGESGYSGAFTTFSSLQTVAQVTSPSGVVTTAGGVTVTYYLRIPADTSIVNDDGSIIMSLYPAWVAAKKAAIANVLTQASITKSDAVNSVLMLKCSEHSSSIFATSRKLRDVDNYFTYSKEFAKRHLATSTPFDTATAQPPSVENPELTEDASWSPTMAPTQIALPSLGLKYQVVRPAKTDLRHSLTLNVTLSGPSYTGVIYCAAFLKPLDTAQGYLGSQVQSAVFQQLTQFADVAPNLFYLITINGLQPSTPYYTACQVVVLGLGTSFFALNPDYVETGTYSCARNGACLSNDQILANMAASSTQCCKLVTWTSSPPSVYWDVFNMYNPGDTSYYFTFSLSDPPASSLSLSVVKTMFSGPGAETQEHFDELQISTPKFVFNQESAAYTGSFFLSISCTGNACLLLGGKVVLSLAFTEKTGSYAQYTLPGALTVNVLDSKSSRPAPVVLPGSRGLKFSNSGSSATLVFDTAADIAAAARNIFLNGTRNTFGCSSMFTFAILNGTDQGSQPPMYSHAVGPQLNSTGGPIRGTYTPAFDIADYLNCTWINNTAILINFGSIKPGSPKGCGNPPFPSSSLVPCYTDDVLLSSLPIVNTVMQLKADIVPSLCPIPGACPEWPKNVAQSVSFAGSSSALAVKAIVTAPKNVSGCDNPPIDAGSSAGNGGRKFTNVNWVVKFVRDLTGAAQVDMGTPATPATPPPLNSFTDVNRNMAAGTNPYARGYSSNKYPAYFVGHEIPGKLSQGQTVYPAYPAGSYGYACPECLPGPRIYPIEYALLIPPPFYTSIPRSAFSTPGTVSAGTGWFTDVISGNNQLSCGYGGGCGSGLYQIYFYLENYLGSFSYTVAYMYVSDARNVPSVTITGATTVVFPTNDALLVSSNGALSNCSTADQLLYVWNVYYLGTTTPATGATGNVLGTTSLDPRKLKLNPYSFNVGTYTATLTVTPKGPAARPQFAKPSDDPQAYIPSISDVISLSVTLVVGHGPVSAQIAGGYNRNASVDQDVVFDASRSRDYDFGATSGGQPPPSTLKFKWSCVGVSRNVSGIDCGKFLYSGLSQDVGKKVRVTSQYIVYFPASILQVLQSYAISLFVSTVDGRYDSKTVLLSVTRPGTPAVIVTSSAIKFNPNSPLKVFGTISADFEVEAQWSVFYSGIQVYPRSSTQTIKSFTSSEAAASISFPVGFEINQFISGRQYSFRLSASPAGNPSLAASSTVVLLVNSPPTGGFLTVDNGAGRTCIPPESLLPCNNGTALTTKYTMTASLWTTDPSNLPLLYDFHFNLDPTAPELLIQDVSQKTFSESTFPAGYPQNNNEVNIINGAYDIYQAFAQVVQIATVTNPPGDQTAFLSKSLSSGLASASASGNPDKAYQTINNVASAVNSVNCTGFSTSDCFTRFNRSSCLTIPLTCESCLPGYEGVIGPSNTKCFKIGTGPGRNGANCTMDDDCLYNYCDPITKHCAPKPLLCPSSVTDVICSGHGKCVYTDTSGNVKPSCTINDVFCRAACNCTDGYGAQDCSLSPEQRIGRDKNRGLMCQSLYSTATRQDPSAQLLDSLVGTLLSTWNPSEVISTASKAICNSMLSKLTTLAGSGYLKGAKPTTVAFLSQTISGFITPPPKVEEMYSSPGPTARPTLMPTARAPTAPDPNAPGTSANTAVQNLVGGVTKTTVPGQAPQPLTTPNVRVSVDHSQLSALNGGALSPPSTAAEAAYGALPPKIALPADGLSGCGMGKAGYAQLSTMQWGQNPYAGANDVKSPVLRFSNSKSANGKGRRRLLTRTGRRMLKLTSRKVKLSSVPLYYIIMQYAAPQHLNFSQDLTKKLPRGSKSNFSLPKCQINVGGRFQDCNKCNVSSYTNNNVTFGCYDLTQLCPPGSTLYQKAHARRHLTEEEFQDYETDLEKFEDEGIEPATLSDRQWMLYDQSQAWGSHTEEQRLFYEKEVYYENEIERRRLQGDDDGNTEPSSANDAVSNFGALLAAILAQLAATLSSNPFALDPSKSIPILTFISVLGFTMCSGVFWFLRWDTFDHNYEMYVKEAALQERRKQAADNLAKGSSSSDLPHAKASFSVSSAFTSVTRQDIRASVIAQGATAVATTNTTVAANVGDTRLEVGSIEGFNVGMYIEIGTAGSVDRCKIAAFGSIVTDTPMQFYHPRGSPIVGYEASTGGFAGKGDKGGHSNSMGYFAKDGSVSSKSNSDSVGYNSIEDETASTGDLSTDGSWQRSIDGDGKKMGGLAAGYMDEFMSVVLPAKSLLSDSNFIVRARRKIVQKHLYFAPFADSSVNTTRLVRWCLLCQFVLIGLFIDTLFFGTFYPDDTTCPNLIMKKLCISVPSQIGQKSLCIWTPDADPVNNPTVNGGSCALRPPPSSITFTIMVAILCSIFATPFVLIMTFLMEVYCCRRPNFDKWGWNTDRIVGTSHQAYKHPTDEKVSALGELMDEVRTQRQEAMTEVAQRKQESFMAREVYADFISPAEEAQLLLQKVRTYLTEDLEGGAMPWENTVAKTSEAERLAKMRCVQKRLGIHPDLTSVPLTLRQWLNYGTPLNRLVRKIFKARKKASMIVEELEEFGELESNLKDICLTQHFVLECVTPIRRYALRLEFFIFDGLRGEASPLGWILSWTLYTWCLMFFVYWIFAWGVKQGGAVLFNWGMNFLIGFVMDACGAAILRIILLDVVGIDAVRPQLRVIRRVLEQVGVAYCQENPDRTNEVRVVQTLSPACRAARTFTAKSLASATILRHLDDLDVERCRENRTGRLGTLLFFLIAIPAISSMINDGLAVAMVDTMTNGFLTALILVSTALNDIGPQILVIPFSFLAAYLFYRFLILGPSLKRVQLISQGASAGGGSDGSTRRWKTSRRTKGRISVLGYLSNLGSSFLDWWAKCIVRFSFDELTKKATSKMDQSHSVAQQWQKMNLPPTLQGHVMSDLEFKKQNAATIRLSDESDYNKSDLTEVFAMLPSEILNMKQSNISSDWKWRKPWLKTVAAQYDPKEAFVTKNTRRRGPGLEFRDSAITQNPLTACQRMLQSYIGDAMTPDDDFQYFSNLVDSTKFDNFVYTPELINMVNKSWDTYYPGGIIMSETERLEMRDHLVQWIISIAGQSGQGVRFGVFRRWYISECNRISRLRFSLRKKQFVPAGMVRNERETTAAPWEKAQAAKSDTNSSVGSSSSSDSGIDVFAGKKKLSNGSSNSGSFDLNGYNSDNGFGTDDSSSSSEDMRLKRAAKMGGAAGKAPGPKRLQLTAAADKSEGTGDSDSSGFGAWGKGRGKSAGSSSSDSDFDVDGWDSDGIGNNSDTGSSGGSAFDEHIKESAVFDPRPFDVNRGRGTLATVSDLTVGSVSSSLSSLLVGASGVLGGRGGSAQGAPQTTANPLFPALDDESSSDEEGEGAFSARRNATKARLRR